MVRCLLALYLLGPNVILLCPNMFQENNGSINVYNCELNSDNITLDSLIVHDDYMIYSYLTLPELCLEMTTTMGHYLNRKSCVPLRIAFSVEILYKFEKKSKAFIHVKLTYCIALQKKKKHVIWRIRRCGFN